MTPFCWLLLVATFGCPSVRARDSSAKGDPCARFDSCKTKVSEERRTCACDQLCHERGTCCADSSSFPLMAGGNGDAQFQCLRRRTLRSVYAKRACSDTFQGHVARRLSCEEAEDDAADVVATAPATSRRNGAIYWNADCGVCDGQGEAELVRWPARAACPERHLDMDIDEDYVRRHLVFDRDTSQWGLNFNGQFVTCLISYLEPKIEGATGGSHKNTYCPPRLVDACPEDYADADVISKCSAYYGERKLKGSDEVFFKNVHCAICNAVTLKELECVGRDYHGSGYEDAQMPVQVQFDPGDWLDDVPEKSRCSDDFAYDPFWKRCRRLAARHGKRQVAGAAPARRSASLVVVAALLLIIVSRLRSTH